MKLQISLLVMIAVLSAYIYLRRREDEEALPLLGVTSMLKRVWKNKWRKVNPEAAYPKTWAKFAVWIEALSLWQNVVGGDPKYYPKKNYDVEAWAVDYHKKKADEEKEKKERERKAEEERKANDVCEWVEKNRGKYMR